MKNTGLYRYAFDISVHCDSIDADDISDIHEYFIKNTI